MPSTAVLGPLSGCGISVQCRRFASPATWPVSTSLCTYPGKAVWVLANGTSTPSELLGDLLRERVPRIAAVLFPT
jgi:hypothetical protein